MDSIKDKLNIDLINAYSNLYDEQAIDRQIEIEKQQTEHHIPGKNYVGPGTKIATRIRKGIKPNGKLDKLAQIHDVDYLDKTMTRDEADKKMADGLPIGMRQIVRAALKIGDKLKIGKKDNSQQSTDAAVALRKYILE